MSDAEEEEEVEETQQQQEEVADEEEETEKDISNNEVCTKYQEAGKIANLALQGLVMQARLPASGWSQRERAMRRALALHAARVSLENSRVRDSRTVWVGSAWKSARVANALRARRL